jgi:hypothetical protein
MKKVLKSTPFGYKTAKDLFEKLVLVKFNKLKESDDINDYYDFIFSTGALWNWIIKEKKVDSSDMTRLFYKDKYISIFQSIYNNCKHYELEMEDKFINYYVEIDGELIKGKILNGELFLYDDTKLEDDKYLVDKVSGEYGILYLFCRIKDKYGNEENMFLFEICKNVITSYRKIMSIYYPD